MPLDSSMMTTTFPAVIGQLVPQVMRKRLSEHPGRLPFLALMSMKSRNCCPRAVPVTSQALPVHPHNLVSPRLQMTLKGTWMPLQPFLSRIPRLFPALSIIRPPHLNHPVQNLLLTRNMRPLLLERNEKQRSHPLPGRAPRNTRVMQRHLKIVPRFPFRKTRPIVAFFQGASWYFTPAPRSSLFGAIFGTTIQSFAGQELINPSSAESPPAPIDQVQWEMLKGTY